MRRHVLLVLLAVGCGDTVVVKQDPPPPPPPDCVNGGVICPAGTVCSGATRTCLANNATMRWVLDDACPDGLGIQARFFDLTNSGVWPAGAGQVWRVDVEGGFVDEVLACIAGAQVCYGAEPSPTNGRYWGRSLDGSQACEACCAICGNGDPPPINLVCN